MTELEKWIKDVSDECDRECRVAESIEDLQTDPIKKGYHSAAAHANRLLRAHDKETARQARNEMLNLLKDVASGHRVTSHDPCFHQYTCENNCADDIVSQVEYDMAKKWPEEEIY